MGTQCPPGFVRGIGSCRAACPEGFDYFLVGWNTPGKCVSKTNGAYEFYVNLLPIPTSAVYDTTQYTNEKLRIQRQVADVAQKMTTDSLASGAARIEQQTGTVLVAEHDRIKSEYATADAEHQVTKKFDRILETIRPPRGPPPTAEISKEQTLIAHLEAKHMHVLHASLVTIFLCLLTYLFLPASIANGVSILLLSAGVAVAIYLTKV